MDYKPMFYRHEEKTHEVPDDLLPPEAKKILMLEDDPEFASLMKEFLTGSGCQVTTVGSGVEGLKHIMACDFDVILCDMMMPGLPGDMFYRAVERTKPNLCKRFIFMTGHKGDAKIDAFIRSVKGLMLWKPFQLHDLSQAMAIVIKKG